MAPDFVPGLRLAREFYATSVRPLLQSQFPGLAYAAALLGPGSEVLGFRQPAQIPGDQHPSAPFVASIAGTQADRQAGATMPNGGNSTQPIPPHAAGHPSGSQHRPRAPNSAKPEATSRKKEKSFIQRDISDLR